MKDQTYPIPQYRGKKIGRLEIVDMWGGHQDVPDEVLALGRRFGHDPGVYIGDFLTAQLLVGRQNYKADLRWTPDAGKRICPICPPNWPTLMGTVGPTMCCCNPWTGSAGCGSTSSTRRMTSGGI